jgi:epsilon-lactone hydrolase
MAVPLTFLRHLGRNAPKAAVSRLRKGPRRPSWSYRFELFIDALRDTTFQFAELPYPAMRAAFESLAVPSKVHRQVRRATTSMAAGVKVTSFTPIDPPRSHTDTTILYLHGGGYVFGSVRSHSVLVTRIALQSPAKLVFPEYRLAPEHPFPAAIEDCVAVYRELLKSGVDPKKLVIGGDSAGGGLTMAVLQKIRDAGSSGQVLPLPAGAFLICPWVDLTAEGGSADTNVAFDWGDANLADKWKAAYLNGHDPKDPLCSPAIYGDLRGLPPLLIQVGDAELLHDQVLALARRAKDAGVDARLIVEPDMIHDWHSFAEVFPHCGRAIDEIGAFVRSVVA